MTNIIEIHAIFTVSVRKGSPFSTLTCSIDGTACARKRPTSQRPLWNRQLSLYELLQSRWKIRVWTRPRTGCLLPQKSLTENHSQNIVETGEDEEAPAPSGVIRHMFTEASGEVEERKRKREENLKRIPFEAVLGLTLNSFIIGCKCRAVPAVLSVCSGRTN